MIVVTINMKVLAEKRIELSQTIASLSGLIKMEKGCRRCDFYESTEDVNRLMLIEEWDSVERLTTHLKSEHFKVLRGGTMNLLKEPYERMFYTVFHPAGLKGI